MFKKFLIYLLLFNFLNTILFTAETPSDIAKKGTILLTDEINSVVEFVMQDCLDIEDSTPEDEDDDNPDPLKTVKLFENNVALDFSLVILQGYLKEPNYLPFKDSFKDYFSALVAPPPKLA